MRPPRRSLSLAHSSRVFNMMDLVLLQKVEVGSIDQVFFKKGRGVWKSGGGVGTFVNGLQSGRWRRGGVAVL